MRPSLAYALRAGLSFAGAGWYALLCLVLSQVIGPLGWVPFGFVGILIWAGFYHVGRAIEERGVA